jgi:hypothetical protein
MDSIIKRHWRYEMMLADLETGGQAGRVAIIARDRDFMRTADTVVDGENLKKQYIDQMTNIEGMFYENEIKSKY